MCNEHLSGKFQCIVDQDLTTYGVKTNDTENVDKLAFYFTFIITYQETSSHATRRGTLGHSHLSSPSHYGPILA